ncbi:MAG: AAA family ATPase [Desulfobacterales bacterium]
MYLEHFGLNAKPFQIAADPRFLWLGEKHKEALAILKYGIFDNRGFLLLSGDVGTGKTTLINALLKSLGDETVVATVPDPGLNQLDFFNYISRAFKLDRRFESKESFLEAFEGFLIRCESERKKVLLIVDEAQRLTSELLEEIRLLSNIEKDYTKLLNIFFVGQNEFNDIILDQKNRPLRQRITINYNIEPLDEDEIADYVQFRLSVASCDRKIFDGEALKEIYRYSEGYPRLINIICDHALLTAFVQGEKTVGISILKECTEELKIQSVSRKNPDPGLPYQMPGAIAGAAPPASYPGYIQDQTSYGTRRLSPSDHWIYGIIILFLCVIAGYLVFSAPGRFVRLIGANPEAADRAIAVPAGPAVRSETPAASSTPAEVAASDTATPAAPAAPSSPASSTEAAAAESPEAGLPAAPRVRPIRPPREIVEESLPESAPAEMVAATGPTGQTDAGSGTARPAAEIPGASLLVYFQTNSNELTPEAYEVLEQTARVLEDHPEVSVDIRGYTDASGGYEYNVKISEFRANIVKTYLVGKGVAPERAQTFGMGPENPIASNETFEGRQLNRRVEIEFNG